MRNQNKNLLNENEEKTNEPQLFQVDKNSHINELNNLNEILNINNEQKMIINDKDIIIEENDMNVIKIDEFLINKNNHIKKNIKINNEQVKVNLRSRNIMKEKEMSYKYNEENENRNDNIKINNETNKFYYISLNLLLYKIIFEDFLKKYADNIYHFCQQCFCFIKIDLFFKKILDCYQFYRKKNTPIEKISNLIDLLNALIVEMFEYYKIISKEDIDIDIIKNIYNEIISDLIINNNNNCNNNYNSEKKIKNRKDIINLNFDVDIIFNISKFNKNKISENENENGNISNEKGKSMFFDSDYIVIEKEEDNDLYHVKIYNEKVYNEKELNEYIYSTFGQILYSKNTSDFNENQNLDNISIMTFTDNLLINIKNFFILFKSKRPNYEELANAKNSIFFYKY